MNALMKQIESFKNLLLLKEEDYQKEIKAASLEVNKKNELL
jgi:hypothetical protein